MEIGARVRQVREAERLSQREFAARLDISSGGISQIESGKAMPGGDFLLKINQAFAVDITWLLTGMSGTAAPPPTPVLRPDEAALLDNYRNSPKDQQDILKATSAAFAQHRKDKRSA